MTFSTYESCTVEKGLVGNNILSIVRDQEGYIWIATTDGLSRFDGYHYVNFNREKHGDFFEDNTVNQLICRGSRLLLISASNGLIELNTKTLRLNRKWKRGVTSIDYSNDTTVVLFSDNTLVVDINGKQLKRKFLNKYPGSTIIQNGILYLCFQSETPMKISWKSLKTEKVYPGTPMKMNGKLFKSNFHAATYHSGGQLYVLTKDTLTPHPTLFFEGKRITYYNEGPKGEPLIVLNNKIPYLLLNSDLTGIYLEKKYNAEAKYILKMDESVAFVGTNQGFFQLMQRPKLVRQIEDNALFSEDDIRVRRAIVKLNNNRLLLTGFPTNAQYVSGQLKIDRKRLLSVYDAIRLDGRLFYATDGSGCWIQNTENGDPQIVLTSHLTDVDQLYHISVCNDSLLWIAGKNKLVLLNKNSLKTIALNKSSNYDFYKVIPLNGSKEFLAASNKGLWRVKFNGVNLTILPLWSQFKKEIKDMIFNRISGDLWLATNQGLFVLNSQNFTIKKRYVNANELTNPIVTALIQDNSGRIWASTYSGVSVYGKSIYLLTNKNGIKNVEFNYKSALKLPNGEIMFGGLNCYDIFQPKWLEKYIYTNKFEISGYETVKSNQEKQFSSFEASSRDLQFNTENEELIIYFSNNDYANGKLYRFYYKIDENSWVEMKDSRSLRLSSLSVGQHSIQIKMTSPFGEVLKTKEFTVNAMLSFYRHPQFMVLILTLLLITALIAWYYSRYALKIETETKSRIAMDLHDEAGTILTRLLLYSNRKSLDIRIVQNGLKEALFSIRAFMDSLSRNHFGLLDLQDDLQEFIRKSFSDTSIDPHVSFSLAENYTLSSELYRDIKLCVFEIVTNTIKHSEANQFWFNMSLNGNKINLTFEDNGLLENLDDTENKGNGINNLHKRTIRNSGRIELTKKNPNGLKITIEFNL